VKVGLNPGHYANQGARANGLVEADVNRVIVDRIGHYIRKAGIQTFITSQDADTDLNAISDEVVAAGCNLFLSIHCNASASKDARGIEAFVAKGDYTSKRIAEALVKALCVDGAKNRGVKWDSQSQYSSLAVLRGTYKHMPAILLEVGFLTNATDSKNLRNKYWRELLAKRVARVLTNKGDR
jgi:N-acetylmuramoyl-L-alanine amidase